MKPFTSKRTISTSWQSMLLVILMQIPFIGIPFAIIALPMFAYSQGVFGLEMGNDFNNYFITFTLTSPKAWFLFSLYFFIIIYTIKLMFSLITNQFKNNEQSKNT